MWEPVRTLLFDVSDRPRTFCPRANPFKYLSTGATYSYKYLFFWWRLLIGVCVWFCTLFLAKPYLLGTYYNLLNIRFQIIKEKSLPWRRMAPGKGKKLSSRIESPITEVLRSRRCDAPAAILVGTLAITAVTKHLSLSLGSWNDLITRLWWKSLRMLTAGRPG